MLDITIDNVWKEIDAAERVRDERLRCYDEQVSSYVTSFFRGDFLEGGGEHHYTPENHSYEYVRFMVPQMAYSAPRVRLNSRTYGVDKSVRELTYGINQWTEDTDYGEFLLGPAHDCLFARGITLTTFEDHPYLKGGKTCVKTRLSPRHYFRDPAALSPEEARYQGHSYPVDLDDLIERAEDEKDWILENVKALAENAGVEEYRKAHTARDTIPDRKEVIVYEIWLRDYEDSDHPGAKEGTYGTILTLGVSLGDSDGNGKEAQFLRDPLPYFGHPDGPYTVCEIHAVPDDPYGLAPLLATEGQARDLNRHAKGASRSAAAYKRLILCDTSDPDFVEKVQLGEHDLVLPIEKVDKDHIVPVEIGGITEQNIAYLQLARDRLDRNSGMGDAQRGMASGAKTATAEAIADQNADIGVDYIRSRFHSFVRRDLEKTLWYMWRSDDFALVLGMDAAPELGVIFLDQLKQAVDSGEVSPEEAAQIAESGRVLGKGDNLMFDVDSGDLDFNTLALEIEPMSMERTTEGMAQRRALETFQLVMQVGQAVPMMPWVRWEELLDKIGDSMNVPDLSSLFDLEKAAEAAGQMPQEPGQAKPQGQNPVGGPQPAPQPPSGAPGGAPSPGGGMLGNQTGGQLASMTGGR